MSSSEEYLDNLLKSMMEGNSTGSVEDISAEPDAEPLQMVSDVMEMPEEPVADSTEMPEELVTDNVEMPEELVTDGMEISKVLTADDMGMPKEFVIDDVDMLEEPMVEIGKPDLSAASADSEANKAMTMEEIEDMLASMGSFNTDEAAEEAVPEISALTEESEAEEDPDLSAILDELGQEPEALAAEESNSFDEDESLDFMRDDALENLLADSGDQGDISLDDISLDDLSLEEPLPDMGIQSDEMTDADIDRLLSGEYLLDDSSNNDSEMDGLSLDDLSLDDLSMAEDSSATDDLALTDDFALEDYGESDADLSDLLAGMEHDEDLSEINDLLEKSDQGVAVDDDDMLAMLESVPESENGNDAFDFFAGEEAVAGEPENIRELTQEEREENKKVKKEKKKKEKKVKKDRKRKGAVETDNIDEAEEAATLESLLEGAADAEETPKKQGLFARFLAFLFEADEDEETLADNADGDTGLDELPIGNPSDENKQLLEELSEEDKKNAKKKGKKEKKKKDKKDKKGKKASEDLEEDSEEENEGKSKGKGKKSKKKKKEKEKNPEEEELKEPEKKLSKKKVISVFIFCATMGACIVVISMMLPSYMEKRDARIAYDYQKYEEVYDLLYGKKLNEEDDLLLKKSSIILQMERKLDSYENYEKLDMPLEALDALISGVDRYQKILPKAEQYHVVSEVGSIYDQILEKLSGYGISETDAFDIIASGDNVTYSQRLEDIVYGNGVSMESTAEPIQDILPEEEEIIDRLEKLEEADAAEDSDDAADNDGGDSDENGNVTDFNDTITDSGNNSGDMENETEAEQE